MILKTTFHFRDFFRGFISVLLLCVKIFSLSNMSHEWLVIVELDLAIELVGYFMQ